MSAGDPAGRGRQTPFKSLYLSALCRFFKFFVSGPSVSVPTVTPNSRPPGNAHGLGLVAFARAGLAHDQCTPGRAGWSRFGGHKRGTLGGRWGGLVVACTKPPPHQGRKWRVLALRAESCHKMAEHTGSRISKHWLCQIVARAATRRLRMVGTVRWCHKFAVQFVFDAGGIAVKPTTPSVHQSRPSSWFSACAILPFVADTTLFLSRCDIYLTCLNPVQGRGVEKGETAEPA